MSTATLLPDRPMTEIASELAAASEPQAEPLRIDTTIQNQLDPEFVRQLRNDTCAVRVHIKKFGIRKALDSEQTEKAAGVFAAGKDTLRATKKLIDTRGEEWNAVIRVLYQAKLYWRYNSIPYTEPGWRLIRRCNIEKFRVVMQDLVTDLNEARQGLAEKYSDLKTKARETLGDLFNEDDYPDTIDGQFSLEWDFPSVDPPDYLRQLNPELYAQQLKMVEQRFETSLANAEQSLTDELAKLVAHLADKLKPGEDGKQKQLRATAVDNLTDFFKRFEGLNITHSGGLNAVVANAKQVISGVSADGLKKDAGARATVASSLEALQANLDSMIINAPRRLINLEDGE